MPSSYPRNLRPLSTVSENHRSALSGARISVGHVAEVKTKHLRMTKLVAAQVAHEVDHQLANKFELRGTRTSIRLAFVLQMRTWLGWHEELIFLWARLDLTIHSKKCLRGRPLEASR